MGKTIAVIASTCLFIAGYSFTLNAADAPDISLEHVWARPTVSNATVAAAYFTITDNARPDRLIGVSTPVAASAQLHETINDNGIMKMRPISTLALNPGKSVTFAPGGKHVMLMELKSPLKAGDSFPMILTFEHARPLTVTVNIEASGSTRMDHNQGQ